MPHTGGGGRIGAIRDDDTGGGIDQEERAAERDPPQIRRVLRAKLVELTEVLHRSGEIDVSGRLLIRFVVARRRDQNDCRQEQDRESQGSTPKVFHAGIYRNLYKRPCQAFQSFHCETETRPKSLLLHGLGSIG